MKQLMKISLVLCLACVLLSANAWGQSDDFRNDPGFFDFGQVPGIADEPKVQIDINPLMLSFLTEAVESKKPETAGLLDGLRAIKVSVYELTQGRGRVQNFIDDTGAQLERNDWMRMIYIDSEDSKVRIHVRPNGSSISGMTVMVLSDDNEAVFMNIVGDINLAKLGRIAANVGFKDVIDDISQAAEEVGAN